MDILWGSNEMKYKDTIYKFLVNECMFCLIIYYYITQSYIVRLLSFNSVLHRRINRCLQNGEVNEEENESKTVQNVIGINSSSILCFLLHTLFQ